MAEIGYTSYARIERGRVRFTGAAPESYRVTPQFLDQRGSVPRPGVAPARRTKKLYSQSGNMTRFY